VLAVKRISFQKPTVFAFVSDPVRLGIVASLAHPGSNFTGVTFSEAVLGGKRLQLLIDALPGLERVAVLWGRGFPDSAALIDNIRTTAAARGILIFTRELEGVSAVTSAFEEASRAGAQAVIFMPDNVTFGHRQDVAAAALKERLPTIHSFPPEVRDGGLMSYGPDTAESYERVAALTDRILRGARPADLPVEEPTRFALCVNLGTAKALGVTLPQSILLGADQVIE